MIIKNSETNQKLQTEIIEEGLHHAIIYSVVDLGSSLYKGDKGDKWTRYIRIGFELPDIIEDYGKGPQPAGVFYRTSTSIGINPQTNKPSKLRNLIDSILPNKLPEDVKSFDVNQLIGLNCMILCKHNEGYVNISDFSKYKGEPKKPHNTTYIFDLENFDEKAFQKLGEKTQEKIKQTPEYKKIASKVEYGIEDQPTESEFFGL